MTAMLIAFGTFAALTLAAIWFLSTGQSVAGNRFADAPKGAENHVYPLAIPWEDFLASLLLLLDSAYNADVWRSPDGQEFGAHRQADLSQWQFWKWSSAFGLWTRQVGKTVEVRTADARPWGEVDGLALGRACADIASGALKIEGEPYVLPPGETEAGGTMTSPAFAAGRVVGVLGVAIAIAWILQVVEPTESSCPDRPLAGVVIVEGEC